MIVNVLNHTAEEKNLANGVTVTHHTYTYGRHMMTLDTWDVPGIGAQFGHVTTDRNSTVQLDARVIFDIEQDSHPYNLVASTYGCDQNLDTLMADATEARQAMPLFIEAASRHGITLLP